MSNSTFCPALWEEFFIDFDGSVYACCLYKPQLLGNINVQPLRQIAESNVLIQLRNKSLRGELECYMSCTLLSESEKIPNRQTASSSYESYRRLKLLFGEFCNIACVMCWQTHSDRQELSLTALKQNVDLEPFELIEIQGGEPLAIKSARGFFEHVAQSEKKASFLTNGIPITDQWAEKIARHSTKIHFSLNAATKEIHEQINVGSRWERVWNNIENVRHHKKKLSSDLIMCGHMTITAMNVHEVALFIQTMADKFDQVTFFSDSRVNEYLNEHEALRQSIVMEMRCVDPRKLCTVGESSLDCLRKLGLYAPIHCTDDLT